MSQHRRWTGTLATVSAAALMGLMSCSTAGNPGSEAPTPGTTTPGTTTTITWGTPSDGSALKAERKIVTEFQAANPEITVKVESTNFADYDTKMTTGLRSGRGPDVFRVNHPNVQAWSNAGYLADLGQTLADQKIDTSTFIPGLMAIGKVNNTQYTLPIDTDCRAFWYNPKLLVEAGVVDGSKKAKPPATWDELLSAVSKFRGQDTYGYVYRTDSDYAMAYEAVGPYLKSAGGQILSDDAAPKAVAATDPKTVAAVELLQKIAAISVPPGEANMAEATTNKLFASGKVAMMTAGPWARASILEIDPKLKYGVDYALTTIPTPAAGDKPASAAGGWQIGLNAKSKNQEAAAKFLAFFEQSNNLVSLATTSSFPPLVDGMEGEPFGTDPFYAAFKEMLPNSGLPITPVAQLAQVSAAFEVAGRAAVNEKKDVTAELTTFDQKVNEQVLQ